MKFMIKPNAGKPEKEGDAFIRYTGNAEPFSRTDEMKIKKVGVEPNGAPKLKYTTGLDEDQVKFYGWLTDEQKEEHLRLLREYKPIIAESQGGEDVIRSDNKYYWSSPERNIIRVVNETQNRIFDMSNPENAIVYFNIMAGAFLEVVAPTKQMAEDKQIPHYVLLESDVHDEVADDYSTKADAYMNLKIMDREEGGDALLFLAWVLQAKSKGFGAYTRSTPKTEILKYHGEFIEGKLSKTKRNCPKEFVQLTEKWKEGGLVREAIQIEAYLKAAEYYSYLNTNRENKYELPSGAVLGTTIEEAVETIRKPKNRKDLEALRTFVENKWKD